MGNLVRGAYGEFVYANTTKRGTITNLNTMVAGTVTRPDSFDSTVAKSTAEGLLLGLGSELPVLLPAKFATNANKYFGAIGEALLGEQRMARMALDRELRAAPQFWEISADAATYEAKAGVWAGSGSKVPAGQSTASAVTPKLTTAKPPVSPNYSAPTTIETIASAANAKRVVPAEITYDIGLTSNSAGAFDSSSLSIGLTDVSLSPLQAGSGGASHVVTYGLSVAGRVVEKRAGTSVAELVGTAPLPPKNAGSVGQGGNALEEEVKAGSKNTAQVSLQETTAGTVSDGAGAALDAPKDDPI
jgi:hypothetical protein